MEYHSRTLIQFHGSQSPRSVAPGLGVNHHGGGDAGTLVNNDVMPHTNNNKTLHTTHLTLA